MPVRDRPGDYQSPNVSSSSLFGGGVIAPYAASKAGLDALVKSWADEHRNSDLRINAVYPGAIRTQMRAKALQ